MENKKLRAGIIGATGYVGQRLITMLENHPWFTCNALAASNRSAGMPYKESVSGRWRLTQPMPEYVKDMNVESLDNLEEFLSKVDFCFCAVAMDKQETLLLEERIAKLEVPVFSNNSANRMVHDVPMIIPEINSSHANVIEIQKKRLGTKRGFIAVKPNCSIQSYVPALTPLLKFGIEKVNVCTYQAISGAGKTFKDWPEMEHNLIPYIGGEEEKSETEPLKIWGKLSETGIESASLPVISAQCFRVAVQEGHTAAVSVSFTNKPEKNEIIEIWQNYETEANRLGLPSAPNPFIKYFSENDRPQPKLDAMFGNGMGITVSRLREDSIFDYKFACLSHNTIRGAAGGSMLTAELFAKLGYIK